jgi:hypothetical protein
MLACRAAHVLVIFGATHRSSSGETAKERVDGLTIEGLKLTKALHISLPHLKVSCLGESEMNIISCCLDYWLTTPRVVGSGTAQDIVDVVQSLSLPSL